MNSFQTFLRTKPSRWVAFLYAAVTLALSQIPLFNYLGYEFSAAIGIVAGLLAGLLTISLFRRQFSDNAVVSKRDLFSFTLYAVATNAVLLLVPLFLISLNAFFVKNCSFADGLAFFFLIPVVTIFFAIALGLSTAAWFRRSVLAYVVLFLLILLHPLYLALTKPQLFAYNFLFGYFPGFTYDEVLTITKTLLLSRLVTFVMAITLLSVTMVIAEHSSRLDSVITKFKLLRYLLQRNRESLVAFSGFIFLVGAYIFRGELGFGSSAGFIQKELGSKYTTLHFNIYYSSSQATENRIKWIAAEHEFRYLQVSRIFQTDSRGKIDSYVYPTPQVKRRLIGTSTTNIAKPWRREIHLSLDSFESTFRHELVHVLAGDFGMPILRISPSPALIEGLAVAVDWNAGDRTPHQFAASLFQFGLLQDISGIFSFTGFAAKPSSVSYLLSGSFCRYLIEEYGLRRFIALYPYAHFQKVYQKPLEDLIAEWKVFLQSIGVPPTDAVRAKLLFARPSIFSKVCARTVAGLNEKAAKFFGEKKYATASNLFESSYAMTNSREAALGLVAAQFHLGKYDSVAMSLERIFQDSAVAPAYVPSKLTLGDCYWMLGQPEQAGALYREIRQLDIQEAYNEAAAVRIESLHYPGFWDFMKPYLAAVGDDTSRIVLLREAIVRNPELSIPRYLLGKIYFRQERYEAALKELSKLNPERPAEKRTSFQDRLLNYQLEKNIGLCLLHLKDFQRAKILLWQSLNYTTNEGDMNLIDDLIEFCNWLDEHRNLID